MKLIVITIALAAVLTAGCGGGDQTSKSKRSAKPADVVTKQTDCPSDAIASHGACSEAVQGSCERFLKLSEANQDADLLENLRTLGRLTPGEIPPASTVRPIRENVVADCRDQPDATVGDVVAGVS
jgi:hypothetical protein